MIHMRTLRIVFAAALLAASAAFAQQNDPVGGGANLNITAGYLSGRGGLVIGNLWSTGAVDPVAKGTFTNLIATTGNVVPQGPNFRNLLDNSAFNIYQRGTTAVTAINTTATYHADRWAGYANTGAASLSLTNVTSSLPAGFGNAEKVQRANSNASLQPVFLVQEIPSSEVIPLQGQNVCVSAYLLAGANYSAASSVITVQVITGTGTDQGLSGLLAATWTGQATTLNHSSQAITTTWTRYTPSGWCFTMPTTATEAAVQFGFTPVGTAGADDSFQITGAQFEQAALNNATTAVGVPTVYEQRHLGVELAKVQRYFWQITEANSFFPAAAACTATNTITAAFPTPVQMRATPTAAFTVGGFQGVINGAGAAGLTGTGVATSNANSVVVTATNACTAGVTVMIRGSGTTGKITATADF
jgi:hypothetical protein